MTIIIRITVAVVLYLLFWGMCYTATGTDKKNIGGFRSYPDEVQKKVWADDVLGELAPKKMSVPITIISNIIMFTMIFSFLGLILKNVLSIVDFKSAFLYFLVVGEGLNLFDLVIIDLLWWRNTKRIRFSFLPEKEMYQNPKKHMDSFWRGIPTFAVVAVLTALIVT